MVGDLGGDGVDVFGADVLGAAFSVVAVAELVVWAVALGRVGFAATAGGAAGVVLLGERSWARSPSASNAALMRRILSVSWASVASSCSLCVGDSYSDIKTIAVLCYGLGESRLQGG